MRECFGGLRQESKAEENGMDSMWDVLATTAGIAVLALLWVMIYDSSRFVVRSYRAEDARIKKACRAVVLSDLHNKRYGKDNERLLAAIRARQPDFILIAGDIVTAKPRASLEPAIAFLEKLAAEYPVYYGNGNHEHRLKLYPRTYGDMALRYGKALEEMGIKPLVNSHVNLPEYGIAVYGSEIDKYFYRHFRIGEMKPDYLNGILGQAPGELYTVLLAHNPDYFPQYAAWGAGLVLSGHVHGGVARVPFWWKGVLSPALRLFPKYDGGIFREGEAVMVLSRGLGTHTIPVRLFNPAELWVVEFAPKT